MKFAANLSTLCQDIPKLTDRLTHLLSRKDFVFNAIECQLPYAIPIEEWKEAIKSVGRPISWVLINTKPLFEVFPKTLELDGGDYSFPSNEEYLEKILKPAIEYSKQLNIPKIHLVMSDARIESQKRKIIDLLGYASKLAAADGITCLIEPLAIRSNYYLRCYHEAAEIVKKCGSPNLKIMLDTFHMQKLNGNLTENIQKYMPLSGHVQISQVPSRNCPISSGEINYPYVLKQLSKNYDDFVGLEYNNESTESFTWLKDFEDI